MQLVPREVSPVTEVDLAAHGTELIIVASLTSSSPLSLVSSHSDVWHGVSSLIMPKRVYVWSRNTTVFSLS